MLSLVTALSQGTIRNATRPVYTILAYTNSEPGQNAVNALGNPDGNSLTLVNGYLYIPFNAVNQPGVDFYIYLTSFEQYGFLRLDRGPGIENGANPAEIFFQTADYTMTPFGPRVNIDLDNAQFLYPRQDEWPVPSVSFIGIHAFEGQAFSIDAFQLAPAVPEPSTYALLALAAGVFALSRIRSTLNKNNKGKHHARTVDSTEGRV